MRRGNFSFPCWNENQMSWQLQTILSPKRTRYIIFQSPLCGGRVETWLLGSCKVTSGYLQNEHSFCKATSTWGRKKACPSYDNGKGQMQLRPTYHSCTPQSQRLREKQFSHYNLWYVVIYFSILPELKIMSMNRCMYIYIYIYIDIYIYMLYDYACIRSPIRQDSVLFARAFTRSNAFWESGAAEEATECSIPPSTTILAKSVRCLILKTTRPNIKW